MFIIQLMYHLLLVAFFQKMLGVQDMEMTFMLMVQLCITVVAI
jgi:hypothetical protein